MVKTVKSCRSSSGAQGSKTDKKTEAKKDVNSDKSVSSNVDLNVNDKSTEKEEFTALIDELKSLLECGICTERYCDPQMLPCQHIFCAKCIDSLLVQAKNECPICRKRFNPATQRACLLMNNLIEFASKHPSLVVVREPTPPVGQRNYVLDDELPGYGESSLASENYNFSEDESHFDYDDEEVSMASYLIHQRIVNYADLMMFLSGNVSDEDAHNNSSDTAVPSANQSSNVRSNNGQPQMRFRNQPGSRHRTFLIAANQSRQNSQFSSAPRRRQRGDTATTVRRNTLATHKIFRRCPDWPTCILGDNCAYTHPWRQCRNGAYCPYGDTCCFLHNVDLIGMQQN